MYKGNSFFTCVRLPLLRPHVCSAASPRSEWDFYTGNDPTHGMVTYLSSSAAKSAGIGYVQPDNTTVLAVDNSADLPVGTNRNS